MLYKRYTIWKLRIAFNKFPRSAKKVSVVYHSGLRYWDAFEDRNYSIVLGVFRVILSIDNNFGESES